MELGYVEAYRVYFCSFFIMTDAIIRVLFEVFDESVDGTRE
jgi:hypothetical protein